MAATFLSGAPWEQQFLFNTTAPSTITSWSAGSALSGAINFSLSYTYPAPSIITTPNKVFIVGCYATAVSGYRVFSADIDSSGIAGTFTATSIVPPTLGGAVVSLGSRILLIGGNVITGSSVGSPTTKVYYTDVDPGTGEIGPFYDLSHDYPVAISGAAAFVVANKLHVIGGIRSTTYPDYTANYCATISSFLELGTWTTTTPLPELYNIYAHSIAVTGPVSARKIHILGGAKNWVNYGGNELVISMDSSGNFVGDWTTPTYCLPITPIIQGRAVVVVSNRIFLFGGLQWGTSTRQSTVYTAPLDAAGNISAAWTALGTSLPNARGPATAFATSSRLYVIGSTTASPSNYTTTYASFSGGLNNYSDYIAEHIPLDSQTSWAISNTLGISTSWAILDPFLLSSTTSWRIKTESTVNSSWMVKWHLNSSTSWAVLEVKTLTTTSSWRIQVSLNTSAAWEILGQLISSTSWIIKINFTSSSAWVIRNGATETSTWQIKNQLENQTTWAVMDVGQMSVNVSWAIMASILDTSEWAIKTAIQSSLDWLVLVQIDDSSSWVIRTEVDTKQTAWSIKTNFQSNTLWVVTSDDYHLPLFIFITSNRNKNFQSTSRNTYFTLPYREKTFLS